MSNRTQGQSSLKHPSDALAETALTTVTAVVMEVANTWQKSCEGAAVATKDSQGHKLKASLA